MLKILLFLLSDCRPLPPCPNIDFSSQTEYIPGKTCKIAPKEKWRLTATPDQIRLVDSARENGNIQFHFTCFNPIKAGPFLGGKLGQMKPKISNSLQIAEQV